MLGTGPARPYSRQPRAEGTETGRFWHLTDIHLDPHYTPGAPPSASCHRVANSTTATDPRSTPLGAPLTLCDTPPSLLSSALAFAQSQGPADFIVVTGDSARHDANLAKPWAENLALLTTVADALAATWPGVPVLMALGNNDVYPHNSATEHDPLFAAVAHGAWRAFIPPAERARFAQFGGYAVPLARGVVGVSLNTILWYASNPAAMDCVPGSVGARHLAWLESVLKDARASGDRVLVAGHVPPARYAWPLQCLARYAQIVREFDDAVAGQVFGHVNVDHFVLLSATEETNGGVAVTEMTRQHLPRSEYARAVHSALTFPSPKSANLSVALVAPSVVPNYYSAVRRVEYDRSGGPLLDYTQFFLNLTAPRPRWAVEYTARDAYGLEDLGAESMARLAWALADRGPETKEVREAFARYLAPTYPQSQVPAQASNQPLIETAALPVAVPAVPTIPAIRHQLVPGAYPVPTADAHAARDFSVPGLVLLRAAKNTAEMPAPRDGVPKLTAGFLQPAYDSATQLVRTGRVDRGEIRQALDQAWDTFSANGALPLDARMHRCQLLRYATVQYRLVYLDPSQDKGTVAPCTGPALSIALAMADARTVAAEADAYVAALAGHALPEIVAVLRLLSTAPGNRTPGKGWEEADVPVMLNAIRRLLNPNVLTVAGAKREHGADPPMPEPPTTATFAFLVELARTCLLLHAAGLEVAADDYATFQVYVNVARQRDMERHAAQLAAGATSTHNQQVRDALHQRFQVDASDLLHVLAANRVVMLGRRMLRALIQLLKLFCRLAATPVQPQPQLQMGTASIVFAWDGDNVMATKEQLDKFDRPGVKVHIFMLQDSRGKWGDVLDAEPDYVVVHDLVHDLKESADYKSVEYLEKERKRLCARPYPRLLVLVSGDGSFAVMENLVHRKLGLVGAAPGTVAAAAAAATGGGCWALRVRTTPAAVVGVAWADMCMPRDSRSTSAAADAAQAEGVATGPTDDADVIVDVVDAGTGEAAEELQAGSQSQLAQTTE
ncbi:Endopolyphosphatase [Blastocladiella emersonii ATCC 22665]|nr:Endopolyphosphatase [Blastocladiella emersonii ATCC 22665]